MPCGKNGTGENVIHPFLQEWIPRVIRGRIKEGPGGIRRNPNGTRIVSRELGSRDASFMDRTVNDSTANDIAQRFVRDLVDLRLRAGDPSYSVLEKASRHELKRATVSERLNGKRAGLPDWPFVFTFVNACRAVAEASGVNLEDLGTVADWKQRWDAAKRGVIDARFPGRRRQETSLERLSEVDPVSTDVLDKFPGPHPLIAHHEGEIVWGSVPPTNDFVGRELFLDDLHRDFMQEDRTGALAIQGVAGIGKTQLAAEYARRHRSEYDLVWWVSCVTQDSARRGMTELASRLGVTGSSRVPDENQFTAVFDELRLSRKYAKWLLIFDGANNPKEIRRLIPPERRNVLITSRNYEWSATDNIRELDVFKPDESVKFLLQRRRGLSEVEAHQLADALGNLPLGLEHAVESPLRVVEYLNRLEKGPLELFSDNPPSAYPETITNTWRKDIDELCAEAPDGMALLRCLAFFGSDPIPRESMERGGFNQEVSLHQILRDPVRFIRAIGALRRMGLLSVKKGLRPNTKTFHVHRLTQCAVRDNTSAADAEQARHDVHLLLAATDPANPDDSDSWPQYEELRTHMSVSGVLGCPDMNVRLLVVNFVRYLCAAGDPKRALTEADGALKHWASEAGIERLGPTDEAYFAMHRAKAEVLCSMGLFHPAFEVHATALRLMQSVATRSAEEITALGRIAGMRLRKEGDFVKALVVDMESREQHIAIFGQDHPQTFVIMHNLSVDHALNGNYAEAIRMADEAYGRCRTFYGYPDHPSVLFQQNAFARCKRLSGKYDEAAEMMNEVDANYRSIVGRSVLRDAHPWFLLHRIDLAATRRDVGLRNIELEFLAEEMEEVRSRCWRILGEDHPLTLAAEITRGSLLRRIPGRLNDAVDIVFEVQRRYALLLGQGHPYSYACGMLLASIRRQLSSAKDLNIQIERGSDFTPLPL